jgi:Tol biopolymer transport system component
MRRGTLFAATLAAVLAVAVPAGAQEFRVQTHSYAFGQAPDWFGDDQVVFHQPPPEGGPAQVYLANLDGSNQRCLTCGQPGPNMVATVRPQRDWILFHSSRGHQLNVGAPGFGGIGSSLMVVRPDGSGTTQLTVNSEGKDDYHAYFSPDGRRVVWTHLDWNFVTEHGEGKWDVRVADFVVRDGKPALENTRVVRPANGHFYETQWWKPDGSGFLYTESVDNAVNLELFFYDLRTGQATRLTHDPAWDEQAIFTPDGKKVIFMSSRDHPGAFNSWAAVSEALGLPADYDYVLTLPVFEFGWLQPLMEQANDLYELDLASGAVRRLTHDGDEGWITPEFAWDPSGRRLLFTQLKWRDEMRTGTPADAARDIQEAARLLQDPPRVQPGDVEKGGQNSNLDRRTRIGAYVQPARVRRSRKVCRARKARRHRRSHACGRKR